MKKSRSATTLPPLNGAVKKPENQYLGGSKSLKHLRSQAAGVDWSKAIPVKIPTRDDPLTALRQGRTMGKSQSTGALHPLGSKGQPSLFDVSLLQSISDDLTGNHHGSGIKVDLEKLDQSRTSSSPLGESTLDHLKSGVKRTHGYLKQMPPLVMLLEDYGVDYSQPQISSDSRLPLEAFEDNTMSMRTPAEWEELMYDPADPEKKLPLRVQALRMKEDSTGRWERGLAHRWDAEAERWIVTWGQDQGRRSIIATAAAATDDASNTTQVLNLHVHFEGDDPVLFAERLARAHRQRHFADSLLKYNFFIDNMPDDRVPKMSEEQAEKIAFKSRTGIFDSTSEFATRLERKLQQLMSEVQKEYLRTQNVLTFEKVLSQGGVQSLLSDLTLPPAPEEGEVPWIAVKPIPLHDFREAFKLFCKNSLRIRPEVCSALQLTRGMCVDLLDKHVFVTQFKEEPMVVQEYVTEQEAAVSLISNKLGMWGNEIRMHVSQELTKAQVKWFNLNETNLDVYRSSRLRTLLVSVQLMMSDTLLFLALDNLDEYTRFVEDTCPVRVEFEDNKKALNNVMNTVVDRFTHEEIVIDPLHKRTLFKVVIIVKDPALEAAAAVAAAAAAATEAGFEENKEGGEKPATTERAPSKSGSRSASKDGSGALKRRNSKGSKGRKGTKDEPDKGEEGPGKPYFAFDVDIKKISEAVVNAYDQGVKKFQELHSIEEILLPHLIKGNGLSAGFKADTKWVVELRERAKFAVDRHGAWLDQVMKLVEQFTDVLLMNPDEIMKAIAEGGDPPPPAQVKKNIEDTNAKKKLILDSLPGEPIVVGFFEIDMTAVRESLISKLDRLGELYLHLLADQLAVCCVEATESFTNIFEKLETKVNNIEEHAEMVEYIKGIPSELSKLQGAIDEAMKLTDLIEEMYFRLEKDTLDSRWKMYGSPGDVKSRVNAVNEYLDQKFEEFHNTQTGEQEAFEVELAECQAIVENFGQYNSLGQVKEVAREAAKLQDRLNVLQEDAKRFNSREVLFDKDPTDYTHLTSVVKTWEPFYSLWKTAGDWVANKDTWLNGNFNNISAKNCENEVQSGTKLMFKTIRQLKGDGEGGENVDAIVGIAEQIKAELEAFKPNLPVIIGLRNEGMRDRHWKQISDKIGTEVSPEMENFNLQTFLDMDITKFTEDIESVGDRAGKEYTLEKTLRGMQGDWENVNFDLSEKYRNSGTSILKGEGEAMALLDEHIVTTQAMQFSIFKGPFEEEIDEWANRLIQVSECLDEWLKCQKAWMYLQPIFDSEDIMKQLPTEGKRFRNVDTTWRKEMINAAQNPKIIDLCNSSELLEKWRDANIMLDTVQKGLEDYLETKRNAFARFYFLSNDELLEILSSAKDPTKVQPFLSKVFEAMAKITFTEDLEITQMVSPEKEAIDFTEKFGTRGKSVEFWMGEVEDSMRKAIRHVMDMGVQDYVETPRKEWVLAHPAQIVLNGSQVHWTSEVEEAFGAKTLDQYAKQLDGQILDLVMIIRSGISKAQRTTIGALVVLDVHAKDVVYGLVEKGVEDASSFEWISQLRYYWRVDDTNQENLWVNCVQTAFPYGYEYLGNSFRLVITPLTDMCYITLMGAQSLNLGGAPAGPAGTGKTETTKDLAKALAKQCVVFNCSPEMDYIMVGKFFKGLAFSGAWCCFDEFNRINIEVLSVIAQQLLVLFGAKAELNSYNDTKQLDFEGTLIIMKPTFNVFITMNPGYAGRAELPDNLAALFRPMAMMVPDYAMIGEIMFYAFGFSEARLLAKKMVTTFKLSSEQLSSQDHYDYGMRAVKSTIEACGALKRTMGHILEEDQITLQALCDVNVPKFLKDDLPLFQNIIQDLFPTTKRPDRDVTTLRAVLSDVCLAQNLQHIEIFEVKIIQLLDTINVRHGLMLVGPTGGGKTCNYRVLQDASIRMCENGVDGYQKVQTHILNPKAITQAQLYGAFDEVTHEWSDGIASEQVRISVADGKAGSPDNHWVIFDGPVDALWIESMNTVLDDNKKLCLTSGEIIALTPQMRMVFEVEDLSVASPATVSRCGMVYMEPSAMGIEPVIQSFIDRLPKAFTKEHASTLHKLFLDFTPDAIFIARKRAKETAVTTDNNLANSQFRILDCYYQRFVPSEARQPSAEEIEKLSDILKPLFFFSLVWSAGGAVDNKGRETFNAALWDNLREKKQTIGGEGMPDGGFLYDYCYFDQGDNEGKWVPWLETIPKFQVTGRAVEYQNIVVPHIDSIRLTHIYSTLVLNQKHVLVCGGTGTGKSCYMSLWLQKSAPDNFISIFANFSAQTRVNQFQDMLDSKFEKRRRGVYGPPAGKLNVIFVDDLNMPQKEYYGAQPPLELLRQWHDYKGWYNRKELKCNDIIDIIMVSAMGPPGGGRTFITERLKRHYNLLAAADLSTQSVALIFSTITDYFLQPFEDSIKKLTPMMVSCAQAIISRVGEELLPTPAKSHYMFNLRDIWKVFQGICSLSNKKVTEPDVVLRCWCHENFRVYGDRLTTDEDRQWFKAAITKHLDEDFKANPDTIFDKQRLIFGDLLVPATDTRYYVEIPDIQKMKEVMEEYLNDYNQMFSVVMPLVMFSDACEHVARICRVLRQPNGNALLLGVGGSGRQSLSRLATFIADFLCFQIEVMKGYGMSNFNEDLKTCLLKCGCELKTQTFLLADTQIIAEQQIEAVNNVLNSGDVPNLYKNEDMDAIAQTCRSACQQAGLQPTKANIFSTYIGRVKANVHVVLAFSPVGDAFRTRLRMFPSLVNCCTLDWFAEWPAEALYGVGKQLMTTTDLQLPNLEGILNNFRTIHQSVEHSAKKLLDQTKRAVYITPTSFLELISSFKKVLGQKRAEVGQLRTRLQKGLDALGNAEWAVANMETELKAMQPVLVKTQKEVGEMMVVIKEDKAKAAVTKEECTEVEKEASEGAAKATAIKQDAQKDLDEALPALDVATKCLKALKLASIQEIKALGNPPAGVRLTLEAICIMFEVKPVKKADPNTPGKKFDDYWEPSQKVVLADPKKLLDDLFEFDKDNIPERVIAKIEPYIAREDFDPAAIKKASVACEALCMWCRAMHKYHFVALAVEPKRQMLAAAEAELSVTMAKLEKAQAQLKQVEDKIARLEADFNAAVKKQDKLQADLDMCSVKLTNANKLINGLGGEKVRWSETVTHLTEKYDLLPGDSLVSAGMVSYAGPFTGEYRKDFEKTWLDAEDDQKLTHTPHTNLLFLGDPVRIQQWSVCGLPNDNLSVENGIIIDQARRWSLMIDPQRQANKYIKTYGKVESQNGMDTCKLSDSNFLQTLELGIQFGKWVLLENIGEELDPALEPILQQQKVKDGSSWVIKLGDKQVTYDLSFRLFITTTLNNPHYSPETSVKVTLLNFAITVEGLQDQMLGIVVAKEQPEMEEKKQQLVKNNAAMNKQLKELEDEILRLLSQDGDILESKELIDTLEVSKKTSGVINKAMQDAKVTEVEIDEARKAYRDYAYRASLLFFCVQEMTQIDPMYQFSLQWFQGLASMGIDNAPAGKDAAERLFNLIDYFTYSLYQSVCRGLFERHKLLFSFALCIKIMAGDGKIDMSEFRFFLTGPTSEIDDGPPNPQPEWISPQAWNEVLFLSRLDTFKGFEQVVADNLAGFQEVYDTQEAENLPVPGGWDEKLTPLQKLCFLRTLRLDRVSVAILNFVQGQMGQHFVEPPVFNIAVSYEDSTKISPLIFVLSSGSDPVADMLAFAEDMGMTKKLESISLGQGQGPKASRMIDSARANGGWVLLCNCHLSVSWLPELERICEQLNPEETHNDYRLWLTSMPTKQFPALLLQNGVKMTNEPPKGLRANVLGSMSKMDDKTLSDCQQPGVYKKLIFAFCFFHAICQDRRKFGPIGWNIAYGFTMEDLITNRRQLKFFLDNYDYVPYPVLNYLGAKINYGGRVTDDKDKRLISCILEKYIHPDIVAKEDGYKFSDSGTYYCPVADCQEEFLSYVRTLPIAPHPEVFGLHGNCEIACAEAEANSYLEGMLSMAPRSSGGAGKSADEVMDEMAVSIIEQTPKKFDLDELEALFPTMYSESRNTVLKQESFKYNRLLSLLQAQLPLFRRALKGLVVMTDELEATGKAMYGNAVPDSWASKGFLSLKPLSAWIKDLIDRVAFLNLWKELGSANLKVFWLSGMFFPQAFLTATSQNFARKFTIAIDKIGFDFDIYDQYKVDGSDVTDGVEFGCLSYGLFLEGCRWDFADHALAVSLPKQLYAQMPLVHFKPVEDRKAPTKTYQCPVYKVLSRKGTLSTTGHSTNFVLYMDIPSKDDPAVWIRGGVALFLALKY